MGRLRSCDGERHPERHLARTSLTAEAFALLLPAFETAFQAHMQPWCLDGTPRTGRSSSTYKHCPLPTPAERLLFILVFLKTNPLQEVHGALFGLPQGKTNMWIHTLLPVVQATFRTLGDAPSRNLADLARRLEASSSDTTTPHADSPPLFVRTGPNDASAAPKIRMNRSAIIAARKSATQSRISS